MMQIKEIGSLSLLNEDGFIINQSSYENIKSKYKEVIELIKVSSLSKLSKEIHSMYIRGSIPRGTEIEGVSDVDVIIITYSEPRSLNLDWVEGTVEIINQKFSFINGIELGFHPLHEIELTTHCSMISFILKTYGVCVYGENLISKLPDYKPNSSLANEHLLHLASMIEQAKNDLTGNEDVEDIKDCCSWIMRIMIRAGLALVMVPEQSYTRDLYPSYKLFSKHYPEKEQVMRTALWYAINPLSNPEEVLLFLERFGNWMRNEADNWLDVYNPQKDMHLPLNQRTNE